VVNWSAFDPREYEVSFNDEKLAVHDVTRWDVDLGERKLRFITGWRI
jgi:hypothetical protein